MFKINLQVNESNKKNVYYVPVGADLSAFHELVQSSEQ